MKNTGLQFRLLYYGIILYCPLVYSRSFSSSQTSARKMTKCEYHQGKLRDRVVCYFSQRPVWNEIPDMRANENTNALQDAQNQVKISILFPLTEYVSTKVAQDAAAIAHNKGAAYTIAFKQVERPMKGIQVDITYNKKLVSLQYDQVAIPGRDEKGLVFTFNNYTDISMIKERTESIVRHAACTNAAPKIILDSGHGGDDDGKRGLFGIKEKDINLALSRKVAACLRREGYQVEATRTDDQFVSLGQRSQRANNGLGDLFVSLHANSAADQNVSGLEIYWCSPKHMSVGSRDRGVFAQFEQVRGQHSYELAQSVRTSVLDRLAQYAPNDRGVKESPFQVLYGTEMPAVLIEVGFLSHHSEAQQLARPAYQDALARGICNGIISYFASEKLKSDT